MILSVHIPKTAGSRFRQILEGRYGRGLALYYGADSPRTHPLARRKTSEFDVAMLQDMARAGVKVFHGHFKTRHLAAIEPDPSRYWIWLREPVEQTVSHYHFVKREEGHANVLSRQINRRDLTVTGFAALDRMKAFQSRCCEPFALADYGFVGISELFPLLLPQLGLRDTASGGNVNREKPMVDLATRRELSAILSDDVALYSEAMELVMRRLRSRERSAGRFGNLLRTARLSLARRPPPLAPTGAD